MTNEEELKQEIAKLKQEIDHLKLQREIPSQGMIKKKAVVAGEMTGEGILGKEVKKIDLSKGFDKEEVQLTTYFSLRGHRLDNTQVCRCSFCNIILTDFEKIEMNNKIYCEHCYRKEEHDLDKADYKILICIYKGYRDTSTFLEALGFVVTIQRITGLMKNEVNNKINKLLGLGYLFLHGLIFKSIRVTSIGEEALVAYNQIYRDEDCVLMNKRIKQIGAYR
jgi:hypothetical protein